MISFIKKMENKQNHYIIRVDLVNFKKCSDENIYYFNSNNKTTFNRFKKINKNDILWFIPNKSNGHIIGIAEFKEIKEIISGQLITLNDEILTEKSIDIKNITHIFEYNNLYNISKLNIYINVNNIKQTIFEYNNENLIKEYELINKYSKISKYYLYNDD